MPPKNNLTFTAPPAPFLAALSSQSSSHDATGPRVGVYNQPRRRQPRNDEEDAPLVLDEEGNEVDFAALQRENAGEGADGEEKEVIQEGNERSDKKQTSDEAKVGAASKKRKARVVAAEDREGDSGKPKEAGTNAAKMGKSKKTKIALSFDDG